MIEGKKLHNLNIESENRKSFTVDIQQGRLLLWERYKHLSDKEIENILNVTINISNCIINNYLTKLWKM